MNKGMWRWLLLFVMSFMALFIVTKLGYGNMHRHAKFQPLELIAIDNTPVIWPTEARYAIVFFATWCPDCRRVYGHIADFKRRHPELPIYGLALEDDLDTVKAWLSQHGNPFAQVAIINSAQSYAMGIAQVPRTLLIEQNMLLARGRELKDLGLLESYNTGK